MNQMLRSFFIISLCVFIASLQAQASDVLERYISVGFKQTSLKEALVVISQKGGFELSYNSHIIDSGKKISLITNNWTVRETLYEVLGEGYEFKSNGNYLILKKAKPQRKEIYGYVKDPSTGNRVANATVYDTKTLRSTTTDKNGYYKLQVKKATQIAITRVDYQDTVISISVQSPRLQRIEMQYDTVKQRKRFNLERTMDETLSKAERFFKATMDRWTAVNVADSIHRHFQISFLPKMGSNHKLSAKVVNDWSLNVLAGVSGGNRILEVGGLGNFTRGDMSGVQIGGLLNELWGNTRGVQIGGIYNKTGESLHGAQIGGVFNLSNEMSDGSGQVAGVFNHASEGRALYQFAGVVNKAEEVKGFQAAGVVNIAQEVSGVQAAAILKKKKKVKGVQIGLFNSAKEVDGLQIGLLNRSGKRVVPLFNW